MSMSIAVGPTFRCKRDIQAAATGVLGHPLISVSKGTALHPLTIRRPDSKSCWRQVPKKTSLASS